MATALILSLTLACLTDAAGFRTVGSSGCAAQMVFIPPYTDTVVFLDNYHPNFGGNGVNLANGVHSKDAFLEGPGKNYGFGAEFNWKTSALRVLHPISNTFCAAGAFFPDGTMLNAAGSEVGRQDRIVSGLQSLRTYSPGPCKGTCTMDFDVDVKGLSKPHWYPTAITLTTGDVVVVGGSAVGGLVTNQASINVPSYEIVPRGTRRSTGQSWEIPILKFDAHQNENGNFSYNLYPVVELLPNSQKGNHAFILAGNRATVYSFDQHRDLNRLPETPLQPRTFPSMSSFAMLPLRAPKYTPTIFMCGGSSTDIPNPRALGDCYTIDPLDAIPAWTATDALPNGPQVMSDAILLPDDTVLLIGGAHKGSAGGFMASQPVLQPMIYDGSKPAGRRWSKQPTTTIPRMYHSVSILLPSGEVLIAGSNPAVYYTQSGNASENNLYPKFKQDGQVSFLQQQQTLQEAYPTEYRVEIFSPPYMDSKNRPEPLFETTTFTYGQKIKMHNIQLRGNVQARLMHSGFRTHANGMGMRSVELAVTKNKPYYTMTAPPDASVIVPGNYMLFVIVNGIPSVAQWVKIH